MPTLKRNVVEIWSTINERLSPPDLETITSLLKDFTNHRIEKKQLITSALLLFKNDEILHRRFTEFLHGIRSQEDEDRESSRNDEVSDIEEGEIREDEEANHLEIGVELDQNPREDPLHGDQKIQEIDLAGKKRKRGILQGVLVEDDDSKNKAEKETTELERVTPSYRRILKEEQSPVSDEVLNNEFVSVGLKKEGHVWGGKKLTEYEKVMARCENDMFETDMLMSALKNAVEIAEKVMREEMRLEDVGVKFYRCIDHLYGGRDMADIVKDDHKKALPVIMGRLKQKIDELKLAIERWTPIWKKVWKENSARERDGSTAESRREK
ncbi:unnamed protein product [Thlaspi arvense]|uniref:Histone deacetylase interacting domain-containing protein n=1 Tax=Thlaspi arvense TaxID=13288 RepID=A0AAU9RWQ6_THLAR|nr:unnamed protein product [Thlaspi arvense]